MGRLVDDERLRRAVQLAAARGYSKSKIARTAGVSRDIVREILTGRPHHRRKRPSEIREHNYSTYVNHKCRCHECTAEMSSYNSYARGRRLARSAPFSLRETDLPAHSTEWDDPTGDAVTEQLGGDV